MLISRKVWLLVAIAMTTCAVVSVVGLYGVKHVNSSVVEIADNSVPAVLLVSDMRINYLALIPLVYKRVTTVDAAASAELSKAIDVSIYKLIKEVRDYAARTTDEDEKKILDEVKLGLASFVTKMRQVGALADLGETQMTLEMIQQDIGPLDERLSAAFEKLVKLNTRNINNQAQSSASVYLRTFGVTISAALMGLVVIGIMGFLIGKSITVPLGKMQRAITRTANELDFSDSVEIQAEDEIGHTLRAYNELLIKFQNAQASLLRKNELIALEKEVAEAATQAKMGLLAEQQELIRKLEDTQGQLMQSEKMASVGQLAAGVAHEINNPIGFINSNLGSLKAQVSDLLSVIAVYERSETELDGQPDVLENINKVKSEVDLAYLRSDIHDLIDESLEGIRRVKKIVDNLKDFSRVDTAEWQYANLEQGLESTLNIVWNELKYKAEIVKEYAGLPEIECIASQVNQIFMNLLVNAAQAIEAHGTIALRTGFDEKAVWVEIEDTGKGIKPEHLNKIFEPFFTTKPVGQGTGLGLSLAYGIVKRHHGQLVARSEVGQGTVFRLTLPREREASVEVQSSDAPI